MSCQTCCKPKTSYNQLLCELNARLAELKLEKRQAAKNFRRRKKSECDTYTLVNPADYQDTCADIQHEMCAIIQEIRDLKKAKISGNRKNLNNGEHPCAKHVNSNQKCC